MLSRAILFSFFIVNTAFALSEEEYNAALQSAFDEIKRESGGSITDQTNLSTWDVQPIGSSFSCDITSKPPPATSVHKLTPYDISVVGAMGDSITAAMGANALTLLDDLIEFKELSWSIGGHKDLSCVTTIPNIIRKYNPNVKGFSTKKWGLPIRNSNDNVAKSGAIAQDMPGQAKALVNKIKADSTDEEFKTQWKLVTLWIGGNNLCFFCKKPDKHSPANYTANIKKALDILYEGLPRTFVNLVQIIDVTRLEPLQGIACWGVHGAVCSCISGSTMKETSKASTDYQEGINDLIEQNRQYNSGDEFAVVVQPFFEGVQLPYKNGKPDKSYFAPDCFHFSTKGHKEAATALWNNMIEPVGNKTVGWELGGDLKCPNENSPYFYTEKNSG